MAIDPFGIAIVILSLFTAIIIGWLGLGRFKIFLDLGLWLGIITSVVIIIIAIAGDSLELYLAAGVTGGIGVIIFTWRLNKHIRKPYQKMIAPAARSFSSKDLSSNQIEVSTDLELADLVENQNNLISMMRDIVLFMQSNEETLDGITSNFEEQSEKISIQSDEVTNDVDEILQKAAIGSEQLEEIRYTSQGIIDKVNSQFELLREATKSSDRISDQTNLIAVNAAIEAAQSSGEGSNFATVAEGIQRLANRSRENTDKLTQLSIQIQRSISGELQKLKKSLDDLEYTIIDVGESANKSSSYTHEQAGYIQNIADYVQQMNNLSKDIQSYIEQYIL